MNIPQDRFISHLINICVLTTHGPSFVPRHKPKTPVRHGTLDRQRIAEGSACVVAVQLTTPTRALLAAPLP